MSRVYNGSREYHTFLTIRFNKQCPCMPVALSMLK